MSTEPFWIYQFVGYAGATLIAAIYIFGLVSTTRRWHIGRGAQLVAIGFLIELITLVSSQIYYGLRSYFASQSGIIWEYTVVASISGLLNAAALMLIVLGICSLLQEISRLHSEPYSLNESDLR